MISQSSTGTYRGVDWTVTPHLLSPGQYEYSIIGKIGKHELFRFERQAAINTTETIERVLAGMDLVIAEDGDSVLYPATTARDAWEGVDDLGPCPYCEAPLQPTAYFTGESWDLDYVCALCDYNDGTGIEWPFELYESADGRALEALGFVVID